MSVDAYSTVHVCGKAMYGAGCVCVCQEYCMRAVMGECVGCVSYIAANQVSPVGPEKL